MQGKRAHAHAPDRGLREVRQVRQVRQCVSAADGGAPAAGQDRAVEHFAERVSI